MRKFGTNQSGREAVSKMASVAVCFLGAVACLAIATLTRSDQIVTIAVCAGLFAAPFLLFALFRMRTEDGRHPLLLLGRKPREEEDDDVEIRRKDPVRVDKYGTNRPPTVDDIREIKESRGVWVPSRSTRRDDD